MGVEKIGEIYKCNICGHEVTVTRVGGGTLVCSGQEMERTCDIEDINISHKLPDSGA